MPWTDRRILDLFKIDVPILQAPMAGASTPEMAIAVSEAGGLGSLPCAQYDLAGAQAALQQVRAATKRPINVNFFCHSMPKPDPAATASPGPGQALCSNRPAALATSCPPPDQASACCGRRN